MLSCSSDTSKSEATIRGESRGVRRVDSSYLVADLDDAWRALESLDC